MILDILIDQCPLSASAFEMYTVDPTIVLPQMSQRLWIRQLVIKALFIRRHVKSPTRWPREVIDDHRQNSIVTCTLAWCVFSIFKSVGYLYIIHTFLKSPPTISGKNNIKNVVFLHVHDTVHSKRFLQIKIAKNSTRITDSN